MKPVGIIKHLPPAWEKASGGIEFIRSISLAINSGKANWHMSFAVKPRLEVIYLYVAFGGFVQFRVNIMDYKGGIGKMNMYGGEFLAAWWAICTGPMVFPPSPIPMRGFRGFRYTEALW